MKRYLCFILVLLFLSVSLIACVKAKSVTATIVDEGLPLSEMEHPPFLTLVCNGQTVEAKSPRCQWNRPDGTAIYADGPFVFELWLGGDLNRSSSVRATQSSCVSDVRRTASPSPPGKPNVRHSITAATTRRSM
ncbi:MAG: hypothetical protein K6A33_10395 [Clostridiales bacterium]|nr:hypothetical protein [Clostridiales bacterium]